MKLPLVQYTKDASGNVKSPPRKAHIMRGSSVNNNLDKSFMYKTIGVQNVRHFLQNIDDHNAELMKRCKIYLYVNPKSKSSSLKGQRMITNYFQKTKK